ncbi:hypothetical protein BGW36DRAFT_153054 [Talaromyces proteolyticus]|uniref:Uncharacterized protein n=1 Tax=Talaromyces proteolyticus TaxID=1131652 RepID=A0AAD4Q1Q3_9EURO|nr:uncharacterized protein BGW36DRAFT_153054 [Talaromyces proteolyticus]KAH8698954.1 hypothetical protein BGW36DRAFT_153054 [Talaromyces proteolyticus]
MMWLRQNDDRTGLCFVGMLEMWGVTSWYQHLNLSEPVCIMMPYILAIALRLCTWEIYVYSSFKFRYCTCIFCSK